MHSLLHSLHDLFPSKTLVTGLIELLKLVLVAAIIYLALGRLVRAAVAASSRRITHPAHRQRATTLLLLVGNIARYVFIFVVGYWAIQKLFGFDMTPVLASVGVVGLAVGFGAQNLVRDVVSGFFIIMEGQYGIGDLVEVNGVFGQVEEVGLRITKLRDPNGELRYFSNGTITSVNRYTEGHIPYTLNVPRSDPGPVLRALADFDQEFKVFAALPEAGALCTSTATPRCSRSRCGSSRAGRRSSRRSSPRASPPPSPASVTPSSKAPRSPSPSPTSRSSRARRVCPRAQSSVAQAFQLAVAPEEPRPSHGPRPAGNRNVR